MVVFLVPYIHNISFFQVGAVVVAFEDHFCMTKASEALQYLQDPEIPFIATNTDITYPVKPGVYSAGIVLSLLL